MRLKLDRVLRFIVVARELSFTRAAAQLHIDQPWLSRQIIQLEEQLGFELFQREAGRIRLTADGAEFLRHAERLELATIEIGQRAEEMHRRHKRDLSISAAYFTYWFDTRSALLEQFRALRPDVRIDISMTEGSDEIINQVNAAAIDIGLILGPVHVPGLDQILIEPGETSISIPQEDPLAAKAALSLSDLKGRRVAVGPRKNATRHAALYGWIDEIEAVAVEVPEGRRFMAEVAQRDRLFVINLAAGERTPPDFVRRPLRGPKPEAGFYMIRRKAVTSASADRFWRLGEEFAERRAPVELAPRRLALTA